GRDSVLVKLPDFPPKGAKPDPRELRRGRVGIRPGEKLDLLYLARRISLFTDSCPEIGELPFPPLGRVAAQPYLHGLFLKKPNLLQFFVKELSTLAKSGSDEAREDFFRWCSPCKNPESELALTFPYDPGLLYEGEWEAKVKELGRVGATEQLAGVQKLNGLLLRIREEMGGTTPIPYYALVEMDGDGVGHGLRGKDQRQWEAAIKQLDAFSDAAAREIEKAEGVPFYAAADELLFYVPVDKALDAVTKLSTLWDRTVGSTVLSGTTLSGGVVIVHVKDDLTLARDAAGKALKAAKKARRQAAQGASESLRDTGAAPPPWLRVEEHPRAGSPRAVTGPLPSLVEQLRCWAQDRGATAGEPGSAEESLSLRTAHILHEHLLR
ncbi:MAG TPA: hypothetical protein PKW90_25880, partial [Myxococcota bacterium]|nr:hypothetical protein [Myxococcota bacterium]